MDFDIELQSLVLKHCKAAKDVMWSLVCDGYRLLADISDLAMNNERVEPITRYLDNVKMAEPDFRQFISAKNEEIDVVLQRYMLEAATLKITIDFNIDPLKQFPAEITVLIIKTLEFLFEKALNFRSGSHVFLYIKNKKDCIQIYADHDTVQIFEESVALFS